MGSYRDRVILSCSLLAVVELVLQFYLGRGKYSVVWLIFFFILRSLIILVVQQMSVGIFFF